MSLPRDEIVTGSLSLLAILAIEIPWEEVFEVEEMVDSICDTVREEEVFEVREGIMETAVV